jgi:hypothetical protein
MEQSVGQDIQPHSRESAWPEAIYFTHEVVPLQYLMEQDAVDEAA